MFINIPFFLFLFYLLFSPLLTGCHLLVVILHHFSFLPSFRFIPLALTLSVSFLPPPFSLPVWPLLPASSGDHAHQATLQTPLSTFQASLSLIPPLLSLLLILLFPPWAHVAGLHSAQTHVFRRYSHQCGVDLGKGMSWRWMDWAQYENKIPNHIERC